ncbi:MAG: hypothetical protein J6M22_01830 [Firmicutes bacterium]|nr:hypothetical protein [Bacillota bacterium]
MLAKNRFIEDMKPEAEAFLYNIASAVPGFSGKCADELMASYGTTAETAIKEMTLIACGKHPEAFCQYVIMRACELFLLDPGRKFDSDGKAVLSVYEAVLKSIASDPKKPAGIHNETRLDFVKHELAKKMK